MLFDHFDTSVDVYRLAPASGALEDYQLYLSDVACLIQPLDESFSQDLQGSFGKDFLLFADGGIDIKEGDQLIQGEVRWRVVGKEDYAPDGRERHQELRIRRFHD